MKVTAHTYFMAGPTKMSGFMLWEEGRLICSKGHVALLLKPGETRYALRLGFILRGSEEVLLPDSLLDDWGHEMAPPTLYDWIRDNGPHFPRAELFGVDLDGRPTQCFVRELDLMAGCACFVYETGDALLTSGARLTAILIPDSSSAEPRRIAAPDEIGGVLSMAAVSWWSVDPATAEHLKLNFLA